MPHPRTKDDDVLDQMEQARLISHHLDADEEGRPIEHSEPGVSVPVAPLPAAAPRIDTDIDHTGRPTWLIQLERLPTAQRRFLQVAGLVVVAVVLAAVFSFALGPSPPATLPVIHPQAVGKAFPTYIGYPGSYATGAPASLVDEWKPAPSPTRGVDAIHTALPHFDRFRPFEHMGSLSPYFSAQHGSIDNAKYQATPVMENGTCRLSQVHILHRHGSRYPTGGAPTKWVEHFLRSKQRGTFSGPLAFLNDYEYRLGEELLVPLGREQLHMSGTKAAMDYGRLAEQDLAQGKHLFVRTGSQQRIVDSALAWTTGFWGHAWTNKTDFEVQIEAPGFNTTLAPNFACRAAVEGFQVQDLIDSYLANATARLQAHVHGAQLTPKIVYGMQQLCSYDTVAYGRSDFCPLFTEDEWRAYEYVWDQRFYYDYGAGNAVGAAMGLGWLNEFVSRLTRTPWNARTQTSENATFNAQASTFPVDRSLYADFTHDSVLTSVLAALRLRDLQVAPKLDDAHRAFRTSLLVPFAARMIFEVFDCAPESFVRMKLNDAIVPLGQLSKCEQRADGLCSLPRFLASHADRNELGWWDRCA